MNWDAIGAIAETLGAVGVIASLVYLATQIRHSRDQMSQNTRAMQAGAHQLYEQGVSSLIMDAVRIPDFHRVLSQGWINFEELDAEDAFRFNSYALASMRTWDNAYYQHCCVSEHSGSQALQLQRPENTGHLWSAPRSRKHLPIRSKWKLSTLDGPTTTESKKPSVNPETVTSSPS